MRIALLASVLYSSSLLLMNSSMNAQDVDVCPSGFEEVAFGYFTAVLEEDFTTAAGWVLESEREAWLEWQEWRKDRLDLMLSAMDTELQLRHVQERRKELDKLDVSHCVCEQRRGKGVDAFRVRVDSDGRGFRVLNMRHSEGVGWGVETGHVRLDGEQSRMVTAFMRAVDERRWSEAEVWVEAHAVPRFQGYQAEVENYLQASPLLTEVRNNQIALRDKEWSDVMLWAERESDQIFTIHAEFKTAQPLSCEIVESAGVWRVLMR